MSILLAEADRPHNRVLILLLTIILLGGLAQVVVTAGSLPDQGKATTVSGSGYGWSVELGTYPELDRVIEEYQTLVDRNDPTANAKGYEMDALIQKLGLMQEVPMGESVEVGESQIHK